MTILAFETSAKAASAALFREGVLLGETYQNTGLTHSQTLLSMAESLMASCGITPAEIDAVGVAAGPGSFTGVRIGVAAAKGFAWGKQLPCYGVSTLEAMALSLGVWDGIVCSVMDARRNQVYNGIFRASCGTCTRVREDRAISLEELGRELQEIPGTIYLVGDGSELTHRTLKDTVPNLAPPPEHRRHQRASGVALAAAAQIEGGEVCDAASLTPNYLRLSQAERERLEKQLTIDN